MAFFAKIFGSILSIIYNLVNNYGIAIILFSVLLKIALLPLSIKQQKTMKKTNKIQEQMKSLQFKYKNDPDKLNQETLRLYKSENMSPFSGCLSAIIQLIILLSVFYMVKSPLTYIKKVPAETIENYKNQIQQENKELNTAYPEISIINYKGNEDESVNLNMDLLGIDLSEVPTQNLNNPKVYIIPVLYIISTIVSTKLSMGNKKEKQKLIQEKTEEYEGESEEVKKDIEEVDMMEQTNKSMSLMMPIMSVSISMVAPLGLALYWLVSNVLIIIERIVLEKYFKSKEEKENAK